MRKLFTSVVAALCLAAPVGTLSAQNTQQLTEAQKEAIKKEVLPVVFEQIKEQAGIDILGWANPQISANSLSGVPALESSNLFRSTRAAQTISVKPDSILIDMGAIDEKLAIAGEAKITFSGYDAKNITIGETSLSIDLPSSINVTVLNGLISVATININSELGQMMGLPFTMDVNMSSDIFELDNADIVSCSLALEGTNLEAFVDIESGLQSLIGGLGDIPLIGGLIPEIPSNVINALNVDYMVQIGITGLLSGVSTGIAEVPASLYAVATNTNIPMGDAVLTLDLTGKALFPINKIDVTGYDNEGKADAWSTFNFDATETTSSSSVVTTLFVDKWVAPAADEDSTFNKKTIITMTDKTPSIPTTPEAAVKSVISRVVNDMARAGETSWYELRIEQADKIDATTGTNVATITVSPYTVGTDAIADIDINIAGKGTYTVRATADLAGSNKIAVDVVKAPATEDGEETVYGTAYFTSNIAGVITANESVEESVATMKVVPVQNAIRVTNVDKATYRIVSMTGAVVASGHINGDTYISTASLSQGIYIVAVEANGTLQSVKVKL